MDISIIIPTYNRNSMLYKHLEIAHAALQGISYEIIVINDSKTNTVKIPDGWSDTITIYNNPRQGVASARNLGVTLAKADILLFIDDDMIINREAVLQAIHYLKSHPDICLNVDWRYPFELDQKLNEYQFGRYLHHFNFTSLRGWLGKDFKWQAHAAVRVGMAASYFLAMTKASFAQSGGYDESFPFAGFEDHDFGTRLERSGVHTILDTTVMVLHNEEDRVQLDGWMQRKYRGGQTKKVAVLAGHKDLAIDYKNTKGYLYFIISKMEFIVRGILKLIPNIKLFDPLYFRLVNLLLGTNLYKGYMHKARIMKVTYIISDIDRAVFFEHTAIRLQEAGIDLSFILINSEHSALGAFLRSHGFKVSDIQVGKLLFSWVQILGCIRILRREKPDVIHCHLSAANFVGLLAGWLAGVPVRIYTRHSGLPLAPSLKESVLDHIQNKLATQIVAITDNTKQLLLSQGVAEAKITIVHHGFDIDRMMRPDPSEVRRVKLKYNGENKYPVVGVIARWMEWKGIQYIIPAFAQLLQDYPDAKLCLFNASDTADYSAEIKEMLKALPSDSWLAVPFEKNIYDLYHLFDIYVHVPVNPYCEAFGQTYVEALATGVPSIFTLSGVAREFITDDNAYIVPFQDSEAIYRQMLNVMAKQKDVEGFIKKGQQEVSVQFSLENYIARLLNIYKIKA